MSEKTTQVTVTVKKKLLKAAEKFDHLKDLDDKHLYLTKRAPYKLNMTYKINRGRDPVTGVPLCED